MTEKGTGNWGKKFLPYLVLFPSVKEMQAFMEVLRRDGLECVHANSSYRGLLVTLDRERYAVIPRACRYCCVNARDYGPEEFRSIYEDWKCGKREKKRRAEGENCGPQDRGK